MKSIQWGINILFAILFVYLIAGKTSESVLQSNVSNASSKVEKIKTSGNSNIEIRYINSDSIYSDYEMVADLREDLENRQKQYSSSLEGRLKAFEQEVVEFQQKAQSMSQFEGQQKQKDLMAKEQELGEMQQELASKLMEMENQMQINIRKEVLAYLERFKGDGIDLVLDFSSNSSLLMAHDTLDITAEVIDSLNVRYIASKLK